MTWFFSSKPLPKYEIKNLSGEVIFERPWSDLYNRDLSGLVLHNSDLRKVRMEYCDCRGTDFTGSKFNGASMRGCDLRGAIVQYCDLSGADLSEAQIDSADFLCSEFGKPKHRCNLDGAKGIDRAVISSYELINGRYDDGRHVVKFTKIKSQPKKDLTRAERPRCLLILGDPLGPHQKYEGWDSGTRQENRTGSHKLIGCGRFTGQIDITSANPIGVD